MGEEINEVLEFLKTKYRIDPNRVYLTGVSDGGYGINSMISLYPEKIAAAVPVST